MYELKKIIAERFVPLVTQSALLEIMSSERFSRFNIDDIRPDNEDPNNPDGGPQKRLKQLLKAIGIARGDFNKLSQANNALMNFI